ncbi:EAL domain-containing protein [Paraburkholderia sp. Cpub6]|uniref:EAL domain-containing protein n=1 Tax=Paraburkholderia sp. Cpub6 TaxID=2723094 RepID=UPI0016133F1F|nr:EAL domain-containing protein [Paraburkholderia sp. Cpub6]MBB5460158.1 EAL domain-containing protein (putative c-di-GMP-specific phosphodiesterase class I) [Paraburkholderia sp. Cpub6]
MSDPHKKIARKAELSKISSSFRRLSSRATLGAMVAGAAVLMFIAIGVGEHLATLALRENERLIGNDLAASVDKVLDGASTSSRANVKTLPGSPCIEVERKLAELETHLRYVRTVALVENGRVYCSSALGPIDVPLSAYVQARRRAKDITLLAETPFQPGVPVLAVFSSTTSNSGVLYIIEGEYLSDVLVHGVRYGAERAAFAISGNGVLDEKGRFHTAIDADAPYSTGVTSRAWPFTILVASSPSLMTRQRWAFAVASGAIGLLVAGLIAAMYLLAFAPRRLLLAAVRQGLKRKEFHVVYQPIVAVSDRSVVGVEALLRWHHAKWGPISPAIFMEEVESSDMLEEVTRFVLQTALAEMSALTPAFPLRIAVNIAPRDLQRKGFVAEVVAAVRSLPPNTTLVLELTERFLLSESALTSAAFSALRAEGVRFAIDDFGTQYNNLDLLGRFPFDYLKIDRKFVSQVDTVGADLIAGIVALARPFGVKVIAEGVETQSQHDGLESVGVPYAQGYLYQRPATAQSLATSISSSAASAQH